MSIEQQKMIREMLKNHSDAFLKMAFSSEKHERLVSAHGHGTNRTDCGDQIDIFIMVGEGRIEKAAFDAQGCLNTYAVANCTAHLVEGQTLTNAWQLKPHAIMDFLGSLPATHLHCAELAVSALRRALKDFQRNRHEPWRALYKRN